ncbi:MAG: hypothetical protein AAFW87_09590 [Pseudomonadota bacterium]
MGEVQLAAMLCAFLAGSENETRRYFDVNGMARHVRVDCETEAHAIEIGLDGTPSARDSLHQALFYSELTGKAPVVILIDRDGYEGRFEYETRIVAARAEVTYVTCAKSAILRWAATAPWRHVDRMSDDVPRDGSAGAVCNLDVLKDMARGAEG